jgi:hypothetical protein
MAENRLMHFVPFAFAPFGKIYPVWSRAFVFVLVLSAFTGRVEGQNLISLNDPSTASSVQVPNYTTNGNDGNLSTRWAAANSTYPQWWRADLGSAQRINQVIINWFSSTNRYYQYRIDTSYDDTNYATLVDNTGNSNFGDTTNNFSATARFVRIYVTGCSSVGGFASFYECSIFGSPVFQPYAADANTLALFHLDEAGGSVTTNTGSLGGNAYSVSESSATTTPPTVTDIFGYASYAGFSNASSCAFGELIGWDRNSSGVYDGDNGFTLSADKFPMSLLNMGNGGQTPWTLEAMIAPTTTNVNQEIICTDSSATSRGFQFRLNNAGQLELNLIAAGINPKVAIPSAGFHGYIPGNWYHVAATYDGTNIVMYWTLMDPSVTSANPISTNAASVGPGFGAVQGPLAIGNENRGASGENFQGLIDEVRISNVARAGNQMLFSSGGSSNSISATATVIVPPNPVYAGTPVTLSASVNGTQPINYFWQSDGGTGGVTWTNLLNSTTNAYALNTAGLSAGTYQYRLVATNSVGGFTNAPATLNLLAASGPLLVADTAIKPSAIFAGGSTVMSAAFNGTQPIGYQWYFTTNGGGTMLIPGATGTNYTIANAQTNNSGSYFVTASNNPAGLGSQKSSSAPATLTVLAGPAPAVTNSGMFCEFLEHPEETAISAFAPRFGWVYKQSFRGDYQTKYQIIVASSLALAFTGTGDMWNSGLVNSSNSLNVAYGGSALQPNSSYFWRVQTVNSLGQTGVLSAIQQFNTAAALNNPLTTSGVIYQQPSSGSVNCYPLRYVPVASVLIATNSLGHLFIDFGNDAFGFATIHMNGNYLGTNVSFGLGELASNKIVNTSPGATIRYWSGNFTLQNGNLIYTNRSTTGVGTISPPATFGIVSPFRYLELTGMPAGAVLTTNDVTQQRLQTEFDDNAASFNSSSAALNQVWSLCKYSMKALSFDGIYVDGDRERTPYEADTYIHMLSSAAVFNDFTTPRCSFEYLTNHLTWPTEWPMHMVFTAWADYQQTGDPYLLTKYYGFLTNKCMMLAQANPSVGLVQSTPVSGNTASGDIIDWYRIGNTDGYVPEATNAVINAFVYRVMTIMAQAAQLTGHAADAATFSTRANQIYTNYDAIFWNAGSYIDGMATANTSAPGNYFPLAFGLVPTNKQAAVVNFLHSRIAANNGMPPGVYGAQYFLESLFLAGDADTALGLMTTNSPRSWLNMINIGSTITDEAWSIANKSNEDWNHAWGAAAGNLIPRFVLGLRPLAPGYGQILIQPQLGQTLSFAQGTVPTIRGPVGICASNAPGQFQLLVNIPGNVIATVMLPVSNATNPVALVDGNIVNGMLSNNWLVVAGIGSGQHAIWLNTNNAVATSALYNNWAAGWFGTNATNPALAAPGADPDGDGMSNTNEFIAGTNPLDATDTFHIAGANYSHGPSMTVTVNGRAGRHYTLQHSFALAPLSWTNADTQTASADNQTVTLHDNALTGSAQAFLRVIVSYP